MTFTYDPGVGTDRDKVRLYLGDTDQAAPLFTDEEIAATLLVYPNPILAAAMLADAQASKYARYTSVTIDGASVDFGAKASAFSGLAARLRGEADRSGTIGTPALPGTSLAEMDGVDANTDRPRDGFRRDQFSNPGRGSGDRRVDWL